MIHTVHALAISFCLAGTGIAGKFLSNYNITPFLLSFIRFFIANLFLIPFIKFDEIKKITKRNLIYIILMGFVGIFLFNVLFFTALRYTSVITVSLISATNPMVAMLVTSAVALKMPTKRQFAALIFTFIGVSLVIIHNAPTTVAAACNSNNNFGEFLIIAAVFCQICYALLAKHMSRTFSSTFLAFSCGIAGLTLLAPFIIGNDFIALWASLDYKALLALLYIGSLGGAFIATYYIKVVKELGAALCNMIIFSTGPIFTALLSMILLGKAPSLYHFIGGLLVIVGLYIGLAKIK